MVVVGVSLSVIQNGFRTYACYFVVLAAVALTSCQKAADRVENGSAATSAAQAAGSETEIPANTALWVQLEKALDSSKLKVGDHFTGTLAEAVVYNGRDAVPKGATAKGHVTNRESAQAQGSSGLLSLELDSVSVRGTSYSVKANPVTLESAPLASDSLQSGAAAPAVQNAYAPKKGILQFTLSEALRVKP